MKVSVITPTIRPKGLERVREGLLQQTFKDFEWLVDINVSGKSDLNASLNSMIKRAKGELIVFVQDYIEIPPEGIEMFWEAYQKEKEFYTAPVGKLTKKGIKWDWRVDRKECNWQEWEIDYGACPKKALYEIGGFDEALDKYWGFDNVNVGLRADMGGYKFKCLPENKALAEDHDAFLKHPFRKLRNPDFHNERLQEIRQGLKIKL